MLHPSVQTALWLLDLVLRATLILALASTMACLLIRVSAALRHLVWTIASVALLALPLLVWALPAWRALPQWTDSASPARASSHTSHGPGVEARPQTTLAHISRSSEGEPLKAAPPSPPAPLPLAAPLVASQPKNTPPSPAPIPAWPFWLISIWLVGTVIFLLPSLVAAVAIFRLRRRATPCLNPLAGRVLAESLRDFPIRRPITLITAPRAAPMTFGILRPAILVPESHITWTPERWRIVLRHELAHVHRWDLLTQLLAQLMRACYWFHPLAWFACARMAIERERACDDLALAAGMAPATYVEELLAIARADQQRHFPARLAAAALPMARLSSLEARFRAVLDTKRNHNRLNRMLFLTATFFSLLILLPISVLRVRASAPAPAAASPTATAAGSHAAPDQFRLLGVTAVSDAGKPARADDDPLRASSVQSPTTAPAVSRPAPVDHDLIAIQETEVAIAHFRARDSAELDYESALVTKKQSDLDTLTQLMQTGAVPTAEIDDARRQLAVETARLKIAQSNHEQDALLYQQVQAKLQALKDGVPIPVVNPALAQQNSTVGHTAAEDAAALALAKHRADDTTTIDAEKALVAQSEKKLDRLKELHDARLVSDADLDAANTDLTRERSRMATAISQHEEETIKYNLLKAQVGTRTTQPAAASQPAHAHAAVLIASQYNEEVYILGSVAWPGVYGLIGHVHLKEALSASGIDTNDLSHLTITINRRNPDDTRTIIRDIDPVALFKGVGRDHALLPNDLIEVKPQPTSQPATATHGAEAGHL